MLKKIIGLSALLMLSASTLASEVNVYSYRQPFLVEPLFQKFTDKTGIKVNVVFAKKAWLSV